MTLHDFSLILMNLFKAVQNERQPRNTATIRPESLLNDRESERMLREGVASTVGAIFNPGNTSNIQTQNSDPLRNTLTTQAGNKNDMSG